MVADRTVVKFGQDSCVRIVVSCAPALARAGLFCETVVSGVFAYVWRGICGAVCLIFPGITGIIKNETLCNFCVEAGVFDGIEAADVAARRRGLREGRVLGQEARNESV